MFQLGIYNLEEYLRMGSNRRFSGPRVAYNLLAIGDNPSEEQVKVFEDISVTLQTSNGTYRTTFRNRFRDVDAACNELLVWTFPHAPIRVEDRAASHGLTTCEWAKHLLPVFPAARIEASDLLLEFLEISVDGNETFIMEADGTPLQYIHPPFVVSMHHPESWRNPVRRLIAARARKRFRALRSHTNFSEQRGCRIRKIPYIHPEAAALARSDSRFTFRRRSVFELSPVPCDVIRTMNILNRTYFSTEQLKKGFQAIYRSLRPGGVWIAGRTFEEDLSNHATFLQKSESGWKPLNRIGGGWDLEAMALASS